MGVAGAAAATALAAAHVGSLRCIDAAGVSPTDPGLAPVFAVADVGRSRAQVVADTINSLAPDTEVSVCTEALDTDDDVVRAIAGSNFVLCCADPGPPALVYKVNRACLAAGIPWTACSVTGFEGVIGPTVAPHDTACYLCYKMREAACAERPADALAHLEFLDERRNDVSGSRENTAFSAGVIGNMVAWQAFQELSGIAEASGAGSIFVLDFLRLTTTRHIVARKPDCPACGPR
jgi:adenylyltransferase/sulfurtransferase